MFHDEDFRRLWANIGGDCGEGLADLAKK